jgi:UDPglucose 6-dehydrogenase
VAEPGLAELVRAQIARGTLTFTTDARTALSSASVLWVTFDTPVDAEDRADPTWVRACLENIRTLLRPNALVIVSAQVPVGFTTSVERDWHELEPTLQFVCAPENLRLGSAIRVFQNPERVVIGLGARVDRERLRPLFGPVWDRIEWMSLESAEMTKHALNGFLAVSATYANELARICEQVGADASQVERGLRGDSRVGPKAYVAPGPAIAGGTLLRDIGFLCDLAGDHGIRTPLIGAVRDSNSAHKDWVRDRILELLAGVDSPRVAVLGLTYKPGTDTLRRSTSLELCEWLLERDIDVQAFDPAIGSLESSIDRVRLVDALGEVLLGADVAVLATPWPDFARLSGDVIWQGMRRPQVVDQAGFLAHLAGDRRITYVRLGTAWKVAVSAG